MSVGSSPRSFRIRFSSASIISAFIFTIRNPRRTPRPAAPRACPHAPLERHSKRDCAWFSRHCARPVIVPELEPRHTASTPPIPLLPLSPLVPLLFFLFLLRVLRALRVEASSSGL